MTTTRKALALQHLQHAVTSPGEFAAARLSDVFYDANDRDALGFLDDHGFDSDDLADVLLPILSEHFAQANARQYNYIIVRVEEDGRSEHYLNAGHIRKAIHAAAEERDIIVSDNIIRHDRKFLPLPITQDPRTAKPVPYTEAEDLFRKVMP